MKITALTLLLALTAPSFADLPGMPPQPAAADTSAGQTAHAPAPDVRPGAVHREAVVTQTGPVRGSLFKQGVAASAPIGADGQPLIGSQAAPVSFIAVQPPQPKKFRKNDVLTIVVRQDSQSTINGQGNSKKTQDFDFGIQQMIQLALAQSGVPQVGTVGAPSKLPEIKFKYSNDRQSNASQERQDSLSFRMSGTVVDVKPNGTLVVEAVSRNTVNQEQLTYTLSGVCRVEDIAADNTILSTQLANLNLTMQTKGEVYDGTRRGWLNKFLDKVNPF
jgi:flagellar L-ring protein precursor FlgH